jgi:K+-transporting ATPase ATPase B chain
MISSNKKASALFDPSIVFPAIKESFRKLDPRHQIRNPVMFVVEIGSILTTGLWLQSFGGHGEAPGRFILAIALWLWFTVVFANFAEAMAEGRGKAQAANLRKARQDTPAKKLIKGKRGEKPVSVSASSLRKGDVVYAEAGDTIPVDGEIIDGVASVNEAAITGESAPVIRESGGDRSAVTGGTTVLSDWLVIRVTANPGETFLDRMISMVEGAKRQKTPNEIALNILLAGMTIIFLFATGDDDHLSVCDGDALAVLHLQRLDGGTWKPDHRHGACRPSGLFDSDDDWRFIAGHRYRGHGPHDPGQRHRHVRPRGGSRRGRRCSAFR